jgi:serine/threonine protein kinase/outer membrane protein OmpA-like peptidoglycan-associated protein
MEADRWRRINHAFFSTFMLDPERRSALLQKLCCGDPTLADEVSSLVAAHQEAGDFIQNPVISANHLLDSVAVRLMEGRKFGPYRVVRKIDHGGMGVVFLAERADNQFHKLVAIKIIRTGLDSAANLRRFYKERQILANLEHPNIARLLDGGDTEEGLPYLVMEYVPGQTIDVYCDSHRLSIAERLRLFRKVCSAVEYAHRKGVIHRDIKPGNIMVDEEAEPKLVDFGIAKLLSPSSGTPTTIGLPRMTPEYASPEEVRGERVDRATDIYSLGVVLYELLTGQRPYVFRHRTPQEILRAICEQIPEKPSARVCATEAGDRISALRRDRPEGLRRLLVGALDNIVLNAIRKAPRRRYLSAEHFAEDIERYLNAQRVRARRESAFYRGGRLLRTNIAGIIAVSLFIATVAGGIGAMRWYRRLAQVRGLETEKRSRESRRQILEATERARMAEAELSHLRETSELEGKTRRSGVLQHLGRILQGRRTSRGEVVNTSEVVFDAGQTSLSSEARERLARIAGALLECANVRVQVEGHSDSYGDDAYNQALSEERARVVQAYLIAQGFPRSAIVTAAFGATKPVASNNTDFGRRQNRRVEIILFGTFGDHSQAIGRKHSQLAATSLSSTLAQVEKPWRAEPEINLALNKTAIGSKPCNVHEGPEKAFNGSVSGGNLDKWCSEALPAFLQVDLGSNHALGAFVVKHASAGGEDPIYNTRDFEIQISTNGIDFTSVVEVTGNAQGLTRHAIPPTVARFVRINITVPGQLAHIQASRIYELEVYPPADELPHTRERRIPSSHSNAPDILALQLCPDDGQARSCESGRRRAP